VVAFIYAWLPKNSEMCANCLPFTLTLAILDYCQQYDDSISCSPVKSQDMT